MFDIVDKNNSKLVKEATIDDVIITNLEYAYFLTTQDTIILDQIIRKKSIYKFDKEIYDYYYNKMNENIYNYHALIGEVIDKYFGKEYKTDDYQISINFDEKKGYLYYVH